MYYVYGLIDPRTNLPFYIGKGKGDRIHRHYYSWNDVDKHNPHKCRLINKLQKLGYGPVFTKYGENLTEEQAFHYEELLIREWGRKAFEPNGILTNINPGGEGHTGGHRSVDQYNLFGEFIQTFDSILSATQSCGRTGSSQIVGCCKKNGSSKSAYGFFWAYRNEPLDTLWCWSKKKPVYQWTLDGRFVDRFVNISAATRNTKFAQNGSEIGKSCKSGGRAQCRGFRWTYGTTPVY